MFDEPRYPEIDPNKKTAKEVWNTRFGDESYLYGKEPSAFLKQFVGDLNKGKVLDVGTGEGRNAVFLAEKGFNVEAIDCSEKAIEKAKKLAQEKSQTIEAKTTNLDFFLMPLMKFNSVVVNFFKPQPRFFSEIRRGLIQGGTFLIEGYTVEHYKAQQAKNNDLVDFDQCFKPNELLRQLKDFQILYYNELSDGDSHFVQALVKKVGV